MEEFNNEEVHDNVTPEQTSNTIFTLKLPKQLPHVLKHLKSLSSLKTFIIGCIVLVLYSLLYGLEINYETKVIDEQKIEKTTKTTFSINSSELSNKKDSS